MERGQASETPLTSLHRTDVSGFHFSLGFSTRALIVALTKALRVFDIDPTLSFLLRLPQTCVCSWRRD